MNERILEHSYGGEPAITMTHGPYRAMVLPRLGGNLVAFNHTELDLSFLRTPAEHEVERLSRDSPFTYGNPVLFPPNRLENGQFTWNGQQYQLPINEPSTGNHLHGLLYGVPWHVDNIQTSDTASTVTLVQNVDATSPIYQHFPHEFLMSIQYTLSTHGLRQHVQVKNTGSTSMPFMLAFHTNFNVPFSEASDRSDYRIQLTIGERWQLSDRMLPTGKFQPLIPHETEMKTQGVYPFFEAMDNHYTSQPNNHRNYMTLTDSRAGIRLVYDVGCRYKTWMVFNNFGNGDFISAEPQTCVVNAPNTHLSTNESGFIVLEPGGEWSETSRMFVEHF